MNGLRRKVMRFADTFWPTLFSDGPHSHDVRRGLPADARAVGVTYDGRTISIVFESDAFELVEEGSCFPEIMPLLSRLPAGFPGLPR